MNIQRPVTEDSLSATMLEIGQRARRAAKAMAETHPDQRTAALHDMARRLRMGMDDILDANEADVSGARANHLSPPMIDRLKLTPERVESMAAGLETVAGLPDPIGQEIARWTVPSGLDIARVRTPLGVIGIIYESRPNVTADAGGLCVRSGNAAILRGGSESALTSGMIASLMRQALEGAGLPEDAIQKVPTKDRAAVGLMLTGLEGCVDVVVPRGGKSLVARVQDEARVPVIGHLEGLVHMYVDADFSPDEAAAIVVNAKMRRTGICGTLETLLVDKAGASTLLPAICSALADAGCELRGDATVRDLIEHVELATEEDWRTEYLAPILAIRVVDGVEGAISHIARYGSGHTESVLTCNEAVAERFLNAVDAGIVMHNASTQFADGGEFGMGAEIGIATGRIHARGPVGAEQLTTFKYLVRGKGQMRPA